MKHFFISLLASIVGGFLLLFLLFFMLFAIGSASSSSKPPTVEAGTYLELDLNAAGIVDRSMDDPFSEFSAAFGSPGVLGLNSILQSIEKAQNDPNISGIFLNLGFFAGGNATALEIKQALEQFKAESGKPVYAYGTMASQKSYLIASVADSIFFNPEGFLDWRGNAISVTYYKGMLDKLGVQVEAIRGSNNRFKSAVEPFIEEKMSAANREQLQLLGGDIWEEMLSGISKSRGLSTEKLQSMADSLSATRAKQAINQGFFHSLMHDDEWLAFQSKKTGSSKITEPKTIDLADYRKVATGAKSDRKGFKADKIAVLYAQGEFTEGDDAYIVDEATMLEALQSIREDDKIKALVLRVNSPGGQALIADKMFRELELIREKNIPIVVSMGDVAASAGYMISVVGDTVLASPNTVTGSIGVFGMLFNASDLLENKLGLHTEHVTTAAHSNLGSPDKPLDAFERKWLQSQIDSYYGHFVNRVASHRKLDSLFVDSIAQGRVWSGKQALKLGLIDGFGGLNQSISAAAKMAGLETNAYRLSEFPKQKDPFEQVLKMFQTKVLTPKVNVFKNTPMEKAATHFHQIQKQHGKALMRLEHDIEVH